MLGKFVVLLFLLFNVRLDFNNKKGLQGAIDLTVLHLILSS